MFDAITFWLCALCAVGSGLAVFTVNSMARATFALALSFIFVGIALLTIDLHYLGLVSVLMMIMEMSIMAVFMVAYMMNPGGLMPMSMLHNRRGSWAIALGTFAVLAVGSFTVSWPPHENRLPADPTQQLGAGIMGDKGLVMVAVGALLFATMVVVVVLAAPRGRYDRYGQHLEHRRPRDPIPGGVAR